MQITDVRVFPVRDDKLKAFVSVVFESCFMVNDIKVINGRDGYFISMPSRRKKNGEFKDIAHPLNTDTRRLLEERILDEYEQVVALDDPPARRYEKTEAEGQPEQAAARRNDDRGSSNAQAGREPEVRAAPAVAAAPAAESEAAGDPPATRADRDDAVEAADEREASEANGKAEVTESEGSTRRQRRDLDEVVEDHLSDSFWS